MKTKYYKPQIHASGRKLLDARQMKLTAVGLQTKFIVDTQSQLWHTRKINFHFYATNDFALKHIASGTNLEPYWEYRRQDSYKKINTFNNIKKDFISSILHRLRAPRYGISNGHGWPRRNLKFAALLRDIFLEYFGICCLWITEIHYFIKELIGNDKVVTNALLFQIFKVLKKDLYEAGTNNH